MIFKVEDFIMKFYKQSWQASLDDLAWGIIEEAYAGFTEDEMALHLNEHFDKEVKRVMMSEGVDDRLQQLHSDHLTILAMSFGKDRINTFDKRTCQQIVKKALEEDVWDCLNSLICNYNEQHEIASNTEN